jgi:sugar/nucleoside kinase (ribokinase family)
MSAPEFVAIGHVTLDRFGEVTRPGGAALYAAVTAHRLGLSVGLLTSHADDFPLELVPPQIEVVTVPAPETTRFEHRHDGDGRVMAVHGRARAIGPGDVPEDWSDAPIVLLAPVIDEVDPTVASAFSSASIGAAVQGWLRELGPGGAVTLCAWASPGPLLGLVQALFLSDEDVRTQEDAAVAWFQHVPVGVMTVGAAGALLFVNGDRYEVPPRPAEERDPTGAGDVFAAAFLVAYQRDGDPWEAAAAATCAASLSVEAQGWSGVPDRATLEAALGEYRRQRDELAKPHAAESP